MEFRFPVVNTDAVGQRCGAGYGDSWEEAKKDAIRFVEMYHKGIPYTVCDHHIEIRKGSGYL